MRTIPNVRSGAGIAIALSAAMVMSGCSGGVGAESGNGGGGEGFGYQADQVDVDAILGGLEPVELRMQAGAMSPQADYAQVDQAIVDEIEERSGGKITIDLVPNGAIAEATEVDDALADGRLDIAYTVPLYEPAHYVGVDALSKASAGLPTTPVHGDAVSAAVIAELAWSDGVVKGFKDKGLSVLAPTDVSPGSYSVCAEPVEEHSDWNGELIRVGMSSHLPVVEDLGATAVNIEGAETYEAMQRRTANCAWWQLRAIKDYGLLEVAPHIGFAEEYGLARSFAAWVGGSSFAQLPLAYQQIIFDAMAPMYGSGLHVNMNATSDSIGTAVDEGGSVEPFPDESEEIVAESSSALRSEVVESGVLGDDIESRIEESRSKWTEAANGAGLVDHGAFEDTPDWYDPGSIDYMDYGRQIFEESSLPHRPA